MESKRILPFLLVFFILTEGEGRSPSVKCEEDHECGENEFCYQTGQCAPCTDCGNYFRSPHKWKYCSKSPNECGGCLPGYAADKLTDGNERDHCTQVQQSESGRSIPGDPGQWSNWLYGLMVIGIPVIVLLVILIICRKTGGCRVNRGESQKTELPLTGPVNMRPPPYSSCGGSPLLTRDTGDLVYPCDRVWHTDHQMTGSGSCLDKESVKICFVEKAIDGVQQARPFKYPDELEEINPRPRTRSSCRPNDETDPRDEDHDNEDGLSVSHDSVANEMDHWNYGSSNDTGLTDVDQNQSGESAAAKRGNIMTAHGCRKCSLNRKAGSSEYVFDRRGSLCNTALRSEHSTYSLCSQTDVEGSHQVPVQCSCKKNLVTAFFLPSKYDSGFISKCSVKFEELHDDTPTEDAQTRRDKPPSREGGSININVPVNLNILNQVNV